MLLHLPGTIERSNTIGQINVRTTGPHGRRGKTEHVAPQTAAAAAATTITTTTLLTRLRPILFHPVNEAIRNRSGNESAAACKRSNLSRTRACVYVCILYYTGVRTLLFDGKEGVGRTGERERERQGRESALYTYVLYGTGCICVYLRA